MYFAGRQPDRDNGQREHGFTLIEILVTVSIFSVIMAAMFGFLWGVTSHWKTGQSTADVTENARMGLNRMTRELMQGSQVTSADTNQVSFAVNFGDGWQTITYGFTPGSIGSPGIVWRKSDDSPMQVTMVNQVANAQFVYYGSDYRCDANGDGVITFSEIQTCSGGISKIARVDIQLTMISGDGSQRDFVGQAWLRNRPA